MSCPQRVDHNPRTHRKETGQLIVLINIPIALEFLAPLAGVIGAAISVPALLVLYFLKLRRRPIRVSSTLLWEQSVADLQVNAPFRMIRPSWILLLQLLALACLLLAMARPSIDRPASGSRVILVLDASASMSARDTLPIDARPGAANITRFERAHAEARNLVSRLPDRTEVMLIALSARAQVITPFTRNHQQVRQALSTIRPTDQPADLDDALRVISAFARGSTGEETEDADDPPRVILLSDGSFAPANSEEGRPPIGNALLEYLRIGPEQASNDQGGENIGIVALAAQRDYDDPALVRVFTRVQGTKSRRISVGVSLLVNGLSIDATTLDIPARTDAEPGEATHRFELRNDAGGMLSVVLSIDDPLDADDQASLVLDPPAGPSIAVIRPDGPVTVGASALVTALATLDPARLDVLGETEALRKGLLGQDAIAFAPFDLVVYDRVRPTALPPVASLSFGATVPIPGLSILPHESAQPTPVTFWARAHAVMRYVTLSDVIIDRPMQLSTPQPSAEDGTRTPVKTLELASGIDSPLIVLVEREGVRRILMAFALDDTNWWRDLSFPTFMANAVTYLAPTAKGSTGRAWTTAQAPLLTWPNATPDATAMLTGPDDFSVQLHAGEDRRAAPGPLPFVGLYEIHSASGAGAVVPVNLLNTIESAAFMKSTVDIGGQITTATPAAAIAPREIWWWFILAALVMTSVEWLVFAHRLRI